MNTQTDLDLYTRLVSAANGPKEALAKIVAELRSLGMSDSGMCRQLHQIIIDIETWQNR